MIALFIGLCLLGYTVWNLRSEEADPLLFFNYLSGYFEITKMEHPYVYWTAVVLQFIVALGSVGYGIFTLYK